MMISTKGRYALQVMLDLAQQCPDAYISLHEISQRQAVSMKYLEAIVAMLNKAGMVESRRGKSGGYRLTRAPEDYTVGAIHHSHSDNYTDIFGHQQENGDILDKLNDDLD